MNKKFFLIGLFILFLSNDNVLAFNDEQAIARDDVLERTASFRDAFSTRDILIGGGIIAAIGFTQWDYGNADFSMEKEGWFEKDTRSRGADKFGHLYATYVVAELLSDYVYENRNATAITADLVGSVSSLLMMTLMEIGDATSPDHGFSVEDQIANTVGALLSFGIRRSEILKNTIDIRLDYRPTAKGLVDDFLTEYDRMRYLMVFKLSGVPIFQNSYAKYLEFNVGYYIDSPPKNADYRYSANSFVGLSLNLAELFNLSDKSPVRKFLKYYQLPYSYVYSNKSLD